MEETFRSSDPINEQRRFTYDRVVDTFRKYYYLVGKSAAVKVAGEARKAFGTGMRTTGGIPEFSKCVQVLLGGDEVFVAAHPYFEPYVHKIISDLDETTLKVGTLNMRTAVAYSKAEEASGPAQKGKKPGLSPPGDEACRPSTQHAKAIGANAQTHPAPHRKTRSQSQEERSGTTVQERSKNPSAC